MVLKKKRYTVLGVIIVLLIVLRLLLPYIVLRYANHVLTNMDGYYGHVNDIDISLYRGAYQLDSIYINKVDKRSEQQTEFFSAAEIDLSVEWKALLDGHIAGELAFASPRLVFTKDRTEIGQVAKDTNDFRKVLESLMPLQVNRFEVFNGSIHYVDNTSAPKVDISLKRTHILAQNLKNTADDKEQLPSPVTATAEAYGGTVSLDMKMNALAKDPTFDLTAEVKQADLAAFNDFFKAYGKFDVTKGTMGLYTELAAQNGKFKGYVKPIIKDLKIIGPEDRKDPLLQKAKEGVFHALGWVLKNHKKEQVATKVPIEGSFSNSDADVSEAIWQVLRNAFIEALMPSVDNEINIQSVTTVEEEPEKKGFFRRRFSSKKKEKREQEASNLRKYSTEKK